MTTIAQLVDRSARRFGDRVAVVDGGRQLNFHEVGERSTRFANVLLSLSDLQGGRVGLLLSNRLEFVEIDFAMAKAGKVKVPINPRLSDEERRFILANCSAEILVTELQEIDRVESIRGELPNLRHVVTLDGGPLDYEILLSNASSEEPGLTIDLTAPSMILHTSGTSGRPKGAVTSQSARIASTANMLLDEYSATESDGMIHVAPMSHGSGSKILAYFVRGARHITVSKFDPKAFFDAIEFDGGTSSFVVPTMIRMLLDDESRYKRDLSGLRNVTYGGAPMPVSLAEEALDAFGPIFTQVYGSCEAPHPVTVLSSFDHMRDGHSYLGSAGHETYGVELRIVNGSVEVQDTDGTGELQVRGANLMSGYWNDPAATESVFDGEWYRTGDVARRDGDGFIYIVGREREMLISGGLNVYPAEIESVLLRHPGVKEAAVFGLPDQFWGEAVAAVIVLRDGEQIDEGDIVRHCVEHLADYKKPRKVVFVDSLPKGVTGKVSKLGLAALVDPSN